MNSDTLYKTINGLVAMYKPSGMEIQRFGFVMKKLFAKGFNKMPRQNKRIVTDIIRTDSVFKIIKKEDTLSNPLVSGPSFLPQDFEMYAANPMCSFSSGVQVLGIGPIGLALSAKMFEENMYMNVYRITCMMGRATHSGTPESNTIVRTSWRGVTRDRVEFILQKMAKECLNYSYVSAGLAPNSQEAYEAIANSSGMLRPRFVASEDRDNSDPVHRPAPIIYNLRCVDFGPPFFTFEVHAIREDIDAFINVMNRLGGKLRTALVMTACRRIQQGKFTADNCLLLNNLVTFDPDEISRHMNYTDSYHSFVSLQLHDNKQHFIQTPKTDNTLLEHEIED